MTAITADSIDWDAARRRRFDGGMAPHGDEDSIIHTRIRWIANNADPDQQERSCPRCTAYKPKCTPICHACHIETRDTDTDQGDT